MNLQKFDTRTSETDFFSRGAEVGIQGQGARVVSHDTQSRTWEVSQVAGVGGVVTVLI